MIENQNIRQILAIMATDIVNYTFFKKTPNNPLIILELSKAYIANGQTENANQNLTKLLGIWEDADADYIYYQEAKTLWKELNMEKAAVA